jgi:hypothetical protein
VVYIVPADIALVGKALAHTAQVLAHTAQVLVHIAQVLVHIESVLARNIVALVGKQREQGLAHIGRVWAHIVGSQLGFGHSCFAQSLAGYSHLEQNRPDCLVHSANCHCILP